MKRGSGPSGVNKERMDQVVAESKRFQGERERGYREQSLRLHPWVCARCGREFDEANLRELTVHHKDHNHDNNPADGSNWENLCIYCHDNEHTRYLDHLAAKGAVVGKKEESATFNPFADLHERLARKQSK